MPTIQESFSANIIDLVWNKANTVPGNNPDEWRKDYAGAWIHKASYGDTTVMGGWEIDHQKPRSKGGSDDLNNLAPLHWGNNRTKCDDYPNWTTSVTSEKNRNIEFIQYWNV